MKKILHIFLSILLLLATTGVSISKHYCMGRLMEVKLTHEKPAFCCLEGESEEGGCCDGETEFMSLDEDFTHVSSFEVPESNWHYSSTPACFEETYEPVSIHFSHPGAHAPPVISTPRFILHGVFLI